MRELSDLKFVANYFLKKELNFFIKLKNERDEDSFLNVIKFIQLEEYKKDEIVFFEGDTRAKFYIILDGVVDIGISSTVHESVTFERRRLLED